MRWTFSDGTTVDLGGNVEGPTLLAQRLRAELQEGATVDIWPPPATPKAVDPNDPALLDAWLRQRLGYLTQARGLKLTLKSPDGIPPLPLPPWAGQPSEPGAVY